MKKFKMLGIIATGIMVLFAVENVSAAEVSFRATNIKYSVGAERVWNGSGEPAPDGPEANSSRLQGSGASTFYLYHVKTSATDPCPNCKFMVRQYLDVLDNGVYLPARVYVSMQMGDTKSLDTESGIEQPGIHYVGGYRNDMTLTNLPATIYGWFHLAN